MIGDGTQGRGGQGGNPYRAKVFTHPTTTASVIELPSDAQGRPIKDWVVTIVDAADFAEIDADPDCAAISDQENLGQQPPALQISRINTAFGKFGVVFRAVAGDTYRKIVNGLLAELGSAVRV